MEGNIIKILRHKFRFKAKLNRLAKRLKTLKSKIMRV